MKIDIPVIIHEPAGITRTREPVTVGIPFPAGLLDRLDRLVLEDPEKGLLPLQVQPLAFWPDGSIKWLLLDFLVDIEADAVKELRVQESTESRSVCVEHPLTMEEREGQIHVQTRGISFRINTSTFLPFTGVRLGGEEMIDAQGSAMVLTTGDGRQSRAMVSGWHWETQGPVRATLFMEGDFRGPDHEEQLAFTSRLTFFAGLGTCRLEYTLHNPRAAEHPGGLWDLGDAGSFLFRDLSLEFFVNKERLTGITCLDTLSRTREPLHAADSLCLYQDSSGGRNWQSRSHVNRNNEIPLSFQGYRVTVDGSEHKAGLRALPCLVLDGPSGRMMLGVRDFWQNFPKALEIGENRPAIRLFPYHFADLFELQGGEKKTHTCFLDWSADTDPILFQGRIHAPLEVGSTPDWYAASGALPYLVDEARVDDRRVRDLVQQAVDDTSGFFARREIIDEYGWRNFGDWYADHEAVGHTGPEPLVAHYNNQYDGIWGSLARYLHTGESAWFTLGDQLCRHVRDIDIYHTDRDKPEFNGGLLWHTEHYLPAETATHRCFSRRHAPPRDLSCYGGGPAMSHNYAAGLLLHYYLTGEEDSRQSVLELVEFIRNVFISRTTLSYFLVETLRKVRTSALALIRGRAMVDFDKVYSMNGPGRGSGNSLSTLMTAYEMTGDVQYLTIAESIIQICIHPQDDIESMDMLDIENRWMYTVFLQALGKYLDIAGKDDKARLQNYAAESLVHYARWMAANEYLYLDTPEKLEFPNETWAAQEIRKCNVFLYAAQYCPADEQDVFIERARYFYNGCLETLKAYDTRTLTRPITLLLQNSYMMLSFQVEFDRHDRVMPARVPGKSQDRFFSCSRKVRTRLFFHILRNMRVRHEIGFLRRRLGQG